MSDSAQEVNADQGKLAFFRIVTLLGVTTGCLDAWAMSQDSCYLKHNLLLVLALYSSLTSKSKVPTKMSNSTNSSSTVSRNPYLLIGIGIVIGLVISFVYSQVFRYNTKTQIVVQVTTVPPTETLSNVVQVTTVPPTEALSMTTEDEIIGKWEVTWGDGLPNLLGGCDEGCIGDEFEFFKGGNLNTEHGALEFSFLDSEHLKFDSPLGSEIATFSLAKENILLPVERRRILKGSIILHNSEQRRVVLEPLKFIDPTLDNLVGDWVIQRRMASDEPCLNIKFASSTKYSEFESSMLGPESVAFGADGSISISGPSVGLTDKVEVPYKGNYQLTNTSLAINAKASSDTGYVNDNFAPLDTSCNVQMTNVKLNLTSNANSSILRFIRAGAH